MLNRLMGTCHISLEGVMGFGVSTPTSLIMLRPLVQVIANRAKLLSGRYWTILLRASDGRLCRSTLSTEIHTNPFGQRTCTRRARSCLALRDPVISS